MDESPSAGPPEVDAWILCGGEGRRMGGADKGLLPWRQQPLALHVAQRLSPQVAGRLHLNANRHLARYGQWGWPVWPDDADLPPAFGPLAGIQTAFRHTGAAWVQLAPCDSPCLPGNLVARLRSAAEAAGVPIAVPVTPSGDPDAPSRHHWTTALAHRRSAQLLPRLIADGERRVARWIHHAGWIGVCFDSPGEFMNINTPETLHGTAPD